MMLLPMEINPRIAFERLFGQPGTAQQRAARMRDNKSILDSVREEAKDLQKTLGGKDQARLSDYLDNVREIEAAHPEGREERGDQPDRPRCADRHPRYVRRACRPDVRPGRRGV